MINAIEWFKAHGFTFDDKITIKDVLDLQKDARQFPPLPMVGNTRLTRAEVIEALKQLRNDFYTLKKHLDPTFVRYPDLDRVLEYIAENGLEPKAKDDQENAAI
jgi:hypothetical protein